MRIPKDEVPRWWRASADKAALAAGEGRISPSDAARLRLTEWGFAEYSYLRDAGETARRLRRLLDEVERLAEEAGRAQARCTYLQRHRKELARDHKEQEDARKRRGLPPTPNDWNALRHGALRARSEIAPAVATYRAKQAALRERMEELAHLQGAIQGVGHAPSQRAYVLEFLRLLHNGRH